MVLTNLSLSMEKFRKSLHSSTYQPRCTHETKKEGKLKAQPRHRRFDLERDAKEMTKLNFKILAQAIIKSGQISVSFFGFVAFLSILLYGKFVWVEPNPVILALEIAWFAICFVGSGLETRTWVQSLRARSKSIHPQHGTKQKY